MDRAFHATNLLSVRTQIIASPFLWNADCPISSSWLHILGQAEYPLLVLIMPQTLAFPSNSVSADLTLLLK